MSSIFTIIFLILSANLVFAQLEATIVKYVDKDVSESGNGDYWNTAYKSISDIDPELLTGSNNHSVTIYFSGGPANSSGKEYFVQNINSEYMIQITKNDVTLARGEESGHNGPVIFMGGEEKPLFECSNETVLSNATDFFRYGIYVNGAYGVEINGITFKHFKAKCN